jgi:hypothetical protein
VGIDIASGARMTDLIGIGALTRLVYRDLVDEVLAETGRMERRSRSLSARVVIYYVLALCLFFGESYEEVMRFLVEGLQFARSWRKDSRIPTTGAISEARQRLGSEPLRALFERIAVMTCTFNGARDQCRVRPQLSRDSFSRTSDG